MSCDALVEVAGWDAIAPPVRCLAVEAEVSARGAFTVPDPGVARTLDLPRARVGVGVGTGPLDAAFRMGAVRSASDDGYLGIEGEALVAEVELATLGVRHPTWGIGARAGVVPDLWTSGADRAWGHSALLPSFGESLGWMDRADLGADVRWQGFSDRIAVAVAVTSGEGARFRERNEGKDIAGTVSFSPTGAGATPVRIELYARNGSHGLGYTRDHRVGARVAGEIPLLGYGVEGLVAWGVDGDGTRAPLGGSAWVEARPWGPLLALGRVDVWSEAMATPDAGSLLVLGAAGATLKTDSGGIDVLAGVRHARAGAAVAALAGADALLDTTILFVQADLALLFSLESP